MATIGDDFDSRMSKELENLLEQVHELLCKQGRVQGGDWTFDGWLPDGRAVKHKFRLGGYERTGPTVDRERRKLGLPTPERPTLDDIG